MQSTELSADQSSALESDRSWIRNLLQGVGSNVELKGTKADIPTLHSLVHNGPYTDNPEFELIVFGTAFGDVIAAETGMKWVAFSDEHGSDLALQLPGRALYVFPRDMLIKRVEGGEQADEIDLEVLLAGVSREIEKAADEVAPDGR